MGLEISAKKRVIIRKARSKLKIIGAYHQEGPSHHVQRVKDWKNKKARETSRQKYQIINMEWRERGAKSFQTWMQWSWRISLIDGRLRGTMGCRKGTIEGRKGHYRCTLRRLLLFKKNRWDGMELWGRFQAPLDTTSARKTWKPERKR